MKKNKMLYRIVAAVLACAVVALALVTYQSRSSSNAPVAEGAVTATGSAKGMEGDVVVEVTADATTIYSITVKEQNETQGIALWSVSSCRIPWWLQTATMWMALPVQRSPAMR